MDDAPNYTCPNDGLIVFILLVSLIGYCLSWSMIGVCYRSAISRRVAQLYEQQGYHLTGTIVSRSIVLVNQVPVVYQLGVSYHYLNGGDMNVRPVLHDAPIMDGFEEQPESAALIIAEDVGPTSSIALTINVSQETYTIVGEEGCTIDLVALPNNRPRSAFPVEALYALEGGTPSPSVAIFLVIAVLLPYFSTVFFATFYSTCFSTFGSLMMYGLCAYGVLVSYFEYFDYAGQARVYSEEKEKLFVFKGSLQGCFLQQFPPLPLVKNMRAHRYSPNNAIVDGGESSTKKE